MPATPLTLSASSIQVCFRSSSSIPMPITALMTAWQVATLPALSHSSASWDDTETQSGDEAQIPPKPSQNPQVGSLHLLFFRF